MCRRKARLTGRVAITRQALRMLDASHGKCAISKCRVSRFIWRRIAVVVRDSYAVIHRSTLLIYLEPGVGLVIVARSRCVLDVTLNVSISGRSSCAKLQHIGGKTAATELVQYFASKMSCRMSSSWRRGGSSPFVSPA